MAKPRKEKREKKEKMELHPRNKHRGRYDLKLIAVTHPALTEFVKTNEYGDETIDFFNPDAVKALNTGLLKHYYGIKKWDIPEGYLCPPIPGRADYIHNLADLLAESNGGEAPTGTKVKCLDIGVGANCIYPIIGRKEYDWSFVGSDTDQNAIKCAEAIVKSTTKLKGKVELRLQANTDNTFMGIIGKEERFDLTVCNPPFHATLHAAQMGTKRKLENLTGQKVEEIIQNFGGQASELTCVGGEARFVKHMIHQSRLFAASCYWFTTLISKHANVETANHVLQSIKASEIKIIKMGQGNKVSRLVAWTFLTPAQREKWAAERWK
jgi:23S rRNA (adenine1618-N6)-methyltransferase